MYNMQTFLMCSLFSYCSVLLRSHTLMCIMIHYADQKVRAIALKAFEKRGVKSFRRMILYEHCSQSFAHPNECWFSAFIHFAKLEANSLIKPRL